MARPNKISKSGSTRLFKFFLTMTDRFAIWSKKRRSTGDQPLIVDVPSHSLGMNRKIWDNYDWSQGGEEWTYDAKIYKGLDPNQWKEQLINDMMLKYIKKGSVILEIGIGAGRWSEILQRLANRLILVDVSKKCLDICRQRFETCDNVEYKLIEGKLDFIDSDSIDYVWSYDVFVHINPTEIESYIEDFQRILKPTGCAIIHHPGNVLLSRRERKDF